MYLYAMQRGDAEGPIKIGTSRDPVRRREWVQNGSEVEIRILKCSFGGRADEKAAHAELAAHHIRGEWYRPHPKVLALVDSWVAAHPEREKSYAILLRLTPSEKAAICRAASLAGMAPGRWCRETVLRAVRVPLVPVHGVNCNLHGGGRCNCDLAVRDVALKAVPS